MNRGARLSNNLVTTVSLRRSRMTRRRAESETPFDASVWQVHEWRRGKCFRWRAYPSKSEALAALLRQIQPLARGLTCAVLVRKNDTARDLAASAA